MHVFADHLAPRSIRAVGERRPWWLLGVVAVTALVVGGLGGWAVANATRASTVPAAEPVARELTTLLLKGSAQHEAVQSATGAAQWALMKKETATTNQIANLFAKDAVATDVGGITVSGDGIRKGWEFVVGQGGAWRVEQVLANDQWAVAVISRTKDMLGHKLTPPRPWVMILKVRNGKIVSESDIYDQKSWEW